MASIAVVLEQRFDRTPDGKIWTQSVFIRSFWARYLSHFTEVRVVARMRDVVEPPEGASRADAPRVHWVGVPWYLGLGQFIRRAAQIRTAVLGGVLDADTVVFRIPSALAMLAVPVLQRQGRTFGVEVVGDPHDVFAPGAVRTPLRPLIRYWFTRALRQQCATACATAYVTERALQRRYPPAPGTFTTHYSSIELPADAVVATARQPRAHGPLRVVTIGTLAQLYKGPDVLLKSVARALEAGVELTLDVVGDGIFRAELERLTATLGIERQVRFLGQLPAGPDVWAALDAADLFVLASRQEGLPRAMIEAMARGLPCIGTTVGGIPELLPVDALVPPNDPGALADRLIALAKAPERRAALAEQNLRKAKAFTASRLAVRRDEFYRELLAQIPGAPSDHLTPRHDAA